MRRGSSNSWASGALPNWSMIIRVIVRMGNMLLKSDLVNLLELIAFNSNLLYSLVCLCVCLKLSNFCVHEEKESENRNNDGNNRPQAEVGPGWKIEKKIENK